MPIYHENGTVSCCGRGCGKNCVKEQDNPVADKMMSLGDSAPKYERQESQESEEKKYS
ncbi:TPA: hypothetical protein HA249_01050 [Candidatus Woesearchaeota archaeon]|nr:hypothetical protein [Candidatus Woesearchaeota archaeon]HIH47573.1 hypothetical protein [Candidatus Woesearchaeota archaeon]HII88057.1 hypothetical protein [Candidatus Woesearchaeota archaeon]